MDSMGEWIERVHRKLQSEASPGELPSLLYPPATPETIAALEAELGTVLPCSYRRFLEWTDGWTGFWFEMNLLGTSGPARNALEAEIVEVRSDPESPLADAVILGANAEEDLFLIYDLGDEEPPVEIYSLQDGTLEVFDTFEDMLRVLAEGETLPKTVPLDLEQQFRAWEENEPLEGEGLTEETQ